MERAEVTPIWPKAAKIAISSALHQALGLQKTKGID